MASISSFNEKFWRASISDRPRHKSAKQIYYIKKSYNGKGYSKKDALVSAEILEKRHKTGEIDLWNMEIKTVGSQVAIRQLEGRDTLMFSELFDLYITHAKKELTDSSIEWAERKKNTLLNLVGDFYVTGSEELVKQFVESGKYSYRLNKANFLNKIFKYAQEELGATTYTITVQSTKAERAEYTQKEYKDFIIESQVLTFAENLAKARTYTRIDREKLGYFYLLSFYIPRRRNDFINMKGSWISDTADIIRIGDADYLPKSQREEIIVPSKEGMELARLIKRKYPTQKIFETLEGHFVTIEFRNAFDKIFPELAGKIHLHNLRDSGIMHLLYEEGMNAQDVMSITGHSKFSSLEKYIHRSAKALILEKKDVYPVKDVLQIKNKWFQN